MSRAGLVTLLILALTNYIALVACAPLPSPFSFHAHGVSSVQRRHLDIDIRATPSSSSVINSPGDVINPLCSQLSASFAHTQPQLASYVKVTRRELPEGMVVLVRRESIGDKIRHAFQHFGEKVRGAFQHVGQKIKEGFQHVGRKISEGFHKVKDAFVHVGNKIKDGFVKAGHAIVHAAHKVGAWMRDTGKKIVKVALKVASMVHKIVGKVVGWIPGIGKPLGRIFDATSHGLNEASKAIHADLGGNLGHAMERMDTGLKVMSYIP